MTLKTMNKQFIFPYKMKTFSFHFKYTDYIILKILYSISSLYPFKDF